MVAAYKGTAYCLPGNRRRQMTGKPDAKDAARFWSYVDKGGEDDCWLWKGAKRNGYGNLWMKGVMVGAHRVVFMLMGLAPPVWPMVCDHLCRNRACVNPKHIRFVHQGVNAMENNDSPFARNKRKKKCAKGHLYGGPTTALIRATGPHGNPTIVRACLICYPGYRNNPRRIWPEGEKP